MQAICQPQVMFEQEAKLLSNFHELYDNNILLSNYSVQTEKDRSTVLKLQ